jgi:transcriptional regulator with XRE-family HTH domain
MSTLPIDHDLPQPAKADDHPPAPDVAGTVLRAARLSAGLSRSQLAEATGLAEQTILAWENGTEPLASVPLPRLEQVKDAMRLAGAQDQLIADLDPAQWCDVVLATLAASEDARCLLADPLAGVPAFAELLGWVFHGKIPARYRRFAPAAPFAHFRPITGIPLP